MSVRLLQLPANDNAELFIQQFLTNFPLPEGIKHGIYEGQLSLEGNGFDIEAWNGLAELNRLTAAGIK